jgi:UTP--glucose-1-phosphate uridylyltransferase
MIQPGSNGELQLTDALTLLLKGNYPILAFMHEGTHFDIGNPNGWLQANIWMSQQQ